MTGTLRKGAIVLASLAALALGGAAMADALDGRDDGPASGEDAARAGDAAVRAVGGGEIVSIDRSDDGGASWDVDVLRDDREVEVLLDENLAAVGTERDFEDVPAPNSRFPDADDRPMTTEQARRAGEAALRISGGGSIESLDRSDDPGEAYEIEVVRSGREIDVALDEDFRQVRNVRYDDD